MQGVMVWIVMKIGAMLNFNPFWFID